MEHPHTKGQTFGGDRPIGEADPLSSSSDDYSFYLSQMKSGGIAGKPALFDSLRKRS